MRPSEVREKSDQELARLSAELEQEIFQLRFRKACGQLKQTSEIRKKRRDLARMKTVLRGRKAGAGKEAS